MQVNLSGNANHLLVPPSCDKADLVHWDVASMTMDDHGWYVSIWSLTCSKPIHGFGQLNTTWAYISVCVNILYYSLFVLNLSGQFGMLVNRMLVLWAFWTTGPPFRPSAYSWPKDWRPAMTNHFKQITTEWYGSDVGGLSGQHAQSIIIQLDPVCRLPYQLWGRLGHGYLPETTRSLIHSCI